MTTESKPATLIYDGECGLCRKAAKWVNFHARPGEIETLPCQSEERKRRFPNMDETRCLEAMQLVLPNGDVYSGEDAFPPLLRRMRGWRWMAGVFNLPLVGRISPRLYRTIATHRHDLTGLFRRKGAAQGCDTEDQTCRRSE